MIEKKASKSFLPDLRMPLRDALRGVATIADAAEDLLEPAASLLPEPVRSRFQQALESIEQAGKRLVHAPVDTRQIEAASRFMTGTAKDKAAIETCANVFVYAWEHLGESILQHRNLISETIVADSMARIAKASLATGEGFAAVVLSDIQSSPAIGLFPGLGSRPSDAETDLALLTIAVWLLAARSHSLEEEAKVLDLSMALVRAFKDDAAKAIDDTEQLARFLSATSSHL